MGNGKYLPENGPAQNARNPSNIPQYLVMVYAYRAHRVIGIVFAYFTIS
jgi:hypothetical protein